MTKGAPAVGAPASGNKVGEASGGEKPDQSSARPDSGKAKESIATVHRPAAPASSPNLDEFKVRPNGAGRIRLRFNDQPWQPVLEWLATISNMSLDWQELPSDSLNLSTQRSYTVPEVRDLINRLLLDRGFTLLCHGEVMTVAGVKKLDPSLVPRVEPADLSSRYPHEFVKVSFPLVSLLAETAAEDLKPMLSPNGRLTSLNEMNRLEAMDAVANLRDIEGVLKRQQSDANQPRSFREFKLKHARADEVANLLSTLLGADVSKSQGSEPQGNPYMEQLQQQQQQAVAMARMQGMAQSVQGSPGGNPAKPKGPISLAINRRNNSIFVEARPDKMAVIAQVVEAVDIPISHDDSLLVNLNRMQVYRLSGVDPEPVVKTLMDIGNLEPSTRLEIDRKNSAIVAYASLADHVTIRAVVDKLSGSERKFEVIRLRRLEADYVAGTIEFMMGSGGKKEKSRPNPFFGYYDQSARDSTPGTKEFRVDADVEHNRLLLWANEIELASVEALLVKLGEIPAAGSGPAGVRVIDGGSAAEADELLQRIRRVWPSIAPNPLLVPPAASDGPSKRPAGLPLAPASGSTTASSLPGAGIPNMDENSPGPPSTESTAYRSAGSSEVPPDQDLIHLADMRREAENPHAGQAGDPRQPDASRPVPPVNIHVAPEGKLIITSEDPQALDRLEELAGELAPPHKDYRVFYLKYAWAVGVSLNLEDFFKEDNKKDRPRMMPWWYDDTASRDDSANEHRLSKRRKLTFIADGDSNTILVEGASAEQLKTIDELIQLYDRPPPRDTQSVRKTEVIRLKYSQAKAVADTVKDVYRDLLSANDRALAENNQRTPTRNYVFNYNDSDQSEQKTPKFKGLLSIGVDEVSNSLTVSAPAYLFEQVALLIKQLDEAAIPDYTVRVVHVSHDITAQRVKEIFDEVYRNKPSEKPREDVSPRKPAKSKPNNQANPAKQDSGRVKSDDDKSS